MNIDQRTLWQEAFGDSDEFLDAFAKTAYAPTHAKSVKRDEKTVAALYWLDGTCYGRKLAYIYAVATAKNYRGQGLCHQLMADTHQHLRENGYAGALLVPGSEELVKLYEGMGYRLCTTVGRIRVAADGAIACREIDKVAYAKQRRRFLPPGGVIQEGESLDFLETQARFYEGDGFVLAARKEKDELIGLELLGDTAKAAKMVGALGCARGEFRTPGKEIPFAMGLFFEDMPKPTYFGLAFD